MNMTLGEAMKLLHASTAVLIGLGGAAGAADRLETDGVFLPGQAIGADGVLETTIDASGDEVLSVHTMIRPASTNIVMMRDRDGYWVNWDGDMNSLITIVRPQRRRRADLQDLPKAPSGRECNDRDGRLSNARWVEIWLV